MRIRKISDEILDGKYGRCENPLWKHPKIRDAFSAMFVNYAKAYDPDAPKTPIVTEEILYIGDNVIKVSPAANGIAVSVKKWGWYVNQRVSPTDYGEAIPMYDPEKILLTAFLKETEARFKRVVLVHGKTGYGKTTFIRHFFNHWLPKVNKSSAMDLVVLRISLAVAVTSGTAEDDVDNRVNRMLRRIAPWLTDKEHMIEMAKMEWPHDSDYKKELLDLLPQGPSDEDKLRWFKLIALRNPDTGLKLRITKVKEIIERRRDFHDFNRIAINYLTHKYGWKFVIIFDNLDQTPINFQQEVFFLARHKLDWILHTENVTLVIGVREYLLDRVKKECPVLAYEAYTDVPIYPPPIQQVLTERLTFFSEVCPKSYRLTDAKLFPQHVGEYVEEITVTRKAIERALKSLVKVFQSNIEFNIATIANYDVRHQLRLAESIFHSWVLDWYDLLYMSVRNTEIITNFYEVLSAMLRVDNLLAAPMPKKVIYNIFDCGESSRFCSTLNGWYVLKLLDNGFSNIEDLVKQLQDIGHPKSVTLETVQKLLHANIVTSDQGIYLKEHRITEITCSWSATTMGKVYLEILPFQLRYLEAMAYLTPLEKEFTNQLLLPDAKKGIPDFEFYVMAAHILLMQIKKDEDRQRDYADRNKVMGFLQENDLLGLAENIAKSVRDTLQDFKDQGHFEEADWDKLFKWFTL